MPTAGLQPVSRHARVWCHRSCSPTTTAITPPGRYRTLYDQRARTTVLVNAAGVLERCNEQTLPALYKVQPQGTLLCPHS